MHHFWGLRQGRNLILNEEESRHARSVLRLSDGDLVRVLDGEGSAWDGALQFINKRDAMVANALEVPNYGLFRAPFTSMWLRPKTSTAWSGCLKNP